MAHRTNPANPLHEVRHLVERAPNADFLKSAELGYVEIRLGNLASLSNWRVILAWPSMRVTGSIVIVLDIFLPFSSVARPSLS